MNLSLVWDDLSATCTRWHRVMYDLPGACLIRHTHFSSFHCQPTVDCTVPSNRSLCLILTSQCSINAAFADCYLRVLNLGLMEVFAEVSSKKEYLCSSKYKHVYMLMLLSLVRLKIHKAYIQGSYKRQYTIVYDRNTISKHIVISKVTKFITDLINSSLPLYPYSSKLHSVS